MEHHLPFIDHESELAFIDSVIQEWGTRRVLCIDGVAGSGKTYLLQEIHRRYTDGQSKTVPVVVTDIIDFDDPALHFFQNVGCKMAHMMGEKLFEPYLRVLLNWRRMEASGVGLEQLNQASLAVNRTFVECFKMISARVLILMDSIESLEQSDLLSYMIDIGRQLENVVLIIAGRNTSNIAEPLRAEMGKDIQTIPLEPFAKNAVETYIHLKHAVLQGSPEPHLFAKLMVLTGGHPVLLDMAIERYTHGPASAWLIEQSAGEIETLPPDQRQQYQEEFERELARYAANIRQDEGLLSMILSRIYPLNIPMIAALLERGEDAATELFEKMQQLVFVKKLPEDRICLHEAALRIISNHIWAEEDPSEEKLRHYSRIAASHLCHQYEAITRRLEHLHALEATEFEDQHEHRADSRDVWYKEYYMPLACDHFLERASLEHALNRVQVQELYYTLYVDSSEGIRTFASMFDEANRAYNFRLRNILLDTLQHHIQNVAPEYQREWERRRVVCLLDDAKYEAARELATSIVNQEELAAELQIETLIELGNAEGRLGHPEEAFANFERAMNISKEHGLEAHFARAQYARGWAYSNQGRYDLALDDYLEAYQLCLKLSDFHQIAWILHNMGYIHALRGNRQSSLESCHAALDLWEELDYPRGLAAAYTVMGDAYARFNQSADALLYYSRALDIFARQNDIEWMSIVRCGRAFAFQSLGELEKAEIEQEWALAHGSIILKPRILHSQFLTWLSRGNIPKAREMLQACRATSQQIGDYFNDYKSFADMIELAWECEEWHKWQEYQDEHTRLYGYREGVDALRLRGSCLRKIADMAVCNGDYDAALAAYEHGLPLVAEYEIHERYTIRAQLRQTDKRLRDHVPDTVMHRLGKDLALFWQSRPELVTRYPEVLLMFKRW